MIPAKVSFVTAGRALRSSETDPPLPLMVMNTVVVIMLYIIIAYLRSIII